MARMSLDPHPGISIHSDRERLIVPQGLDRAAISYVHDRKAEIVRRLRETQMNPEGFYTALPKGLLAEIEATTWIVISVKTTALSRWSTPSRVSGYTTIGTQPWSDYRAAHPGATINSQPRVRILTVYTEGLDCCSWDLDCLTAHERERLLYAALQHKIMIAHDAGHVLGWLLRETHARPAYVLDTGLLVRQLKPSLLLKPFYIAAEPRDWGQATARSLIRKYKGATSTTVEWLACCLGITPPDNSYETATNWSVSSLSDRHLLFCRVSVRFALELAQRMFPKDAIERIPDVIAERYRWYVPFGTAMVRLAEAQVRGVPFDLETAVKMKRELSEEIGQAATEVAQVPQFSSVLEQLLDLYSGETAELKNCRVNYSEGNRAESTEGSIAPELPALKILERLSAAKSGLNTIAKNQESSSVDGKLHARMLFESATGRCILSQPSIQNLPRDRRFRRLIKAGVGNVILSADYSAIELRIAAALAERTIKELRHRVERGWYDGWFMGLIEVAARSHMELKAPPEPDGDVLRWLNVAIPAVAQTVLRLEQQAMMSIFASGLDPHLVTAIDMARRQGRIGYGSTAAVWLAIQGPREREELSHKFETERQQAKAVNFGLLYGMEPKSLHRYGVSDYGLRWTLDDAIQARQAWFELYPEIQLWQLWTRYFRCRKQDQGKVAIWDRGTRQSVIPERALKLYFNRTLAGRPLVLLDQPRQALNHQDQGTGADILANAIALLPEDVANMLLFPVHDELVFEVPSERIATVTEIVKATMCHAANEVLGDAVPIMVNCVAGDTWV